MLKKMGKVWKENGEVDVDIEKKEKLGFRRSGGGREGVRKGRERER